MITEITLPPNIDTRPEHDAAVGHEAFKTQIEGMFEGYETFRPMVDQLYQKLQDPDVDYESQILGVGGHSIVFRAEYEGDEYAVRIPKNRAGRDDILYQHVCGTARCKDEHLERIVAASIDDGVTVAEILPGTPMDKNMTIDDVHSITDDQLVRLVRTLRIASESCLELDLSNPSNVLYDPEAGFGIVDYYCTDLQTTHIVQPISTTASLMVDILMSPGIHGRNRAEQEAASYEADAERLLANSDVLKRYRAIIATQLEETDAVKVLSEIDMILDEYSEIIKQYQNPTWGRDQAMASIALAHAS